MALLQNGTAGAEPSNTMPQGARVAGVSHGRTDSAAGESRLDGHAPIDLVLRNISKSFGAHKAVRDVSFGAFQGEFIALLGPSGCGKTTTLSMIAGFQEPTSGSILVRGERIDGLPPEKRNAGMVFQNYALFPHMSVAENVAFGLKMRGISKARIQEKVSEALRLVQMGGFEDRRPTQLSGGQQQRVALARVLVIEPTILLLDEPFGALDRQLREQMQLELSSLQRSVGITTVFVTHDQGEALSMSDRIAVMKDGLIEQLATPTEMYDRPSSTFVAGFIGKSNMLSGRVAAVSGDLLSVDTPLGRIKARRPSEGLDVGQEIEVVIRPEKISRSSFGSDDRTNRMSGHIRQIAYHGSYTEFHMMMSGDIHFIFAEPTGPMQNASNISMFGEDQMEIFWSVDDTLLYSKGKLCA